MIIEFENGSAVYWAAREPDLAEYAAVSALGSAAGGWPEARLAGEVTLRIVGGHPWLVQSYRDSGEIPPDLADRAADAITAIEGRLVLEDLDHPLSLLRPYLARIAGRTA